MKRIFFLYIFLNVTWTHDLVIFCSQMVWTDFFSEKVAKKKENYPASLKLFKAVGERRKLDSSISAKANGFLK